MGLLVVKLVLLVGTFYVFGKAIEGLVWVEAYFRRGSRRKPDLQKPAESP